MARYTLDEFGELSIDLLVSVVLDGDAETTQVRDETLGAPAELLLVLHGVHVVECAPRREIAARS